MTIRADLVVDWNSSPRVVTVQAPSVEITIQDLHDSCRSLEAASEAMDNRPLIDSSGYEDLGGGVAVGITATLQNALLAFEARSGPTYTQCKVNGGNVVAVDENNVTFSTPISPTAFTQVVVTASSSATSQNQASIEYSSFDGGVWIDEQGSVSGTDGLKGNAQFPVNNIPDAVAIANIRGLPRTIFIIGNLLISSGDDVSNFKIIGQNPARTILTIQEPSNTTGCEITECTVTGVLDGLTIIRYCTIENISYFNGFIYESEINGTITLGNNAQAAILGCYSGQAGQTTPTIDFGGSGQALSLRKYAGGILLENKTGPEPVSIDLIGGQVKIDLTTVTSGTVVVRGTGRVVNNANDDWLPHGIYGSMQLDNETTYGLMMQEIWTAHGLDPDVVATPGTKLDNLPDEILDKVT